MLINQHWLILPLFATLSLFVRVQPKVKSSQGFGRIDESHGYDSG